jgi:hypothetical protein
MLLSQKIKLHQICSQVKRLESQIILKVFVSRKPNDLRRIANFFLAISWREVFTFDAMMIPL